MSEDNTFNDSHNIIWDKSTLNSISGNYVWIIGGSFIKGNPDYFTALDINVLDDKLTHRGRNQIHLFITYLDTPRDPTGVKKMHHYPLNLNLEDWCSNIEPKLNEQKVDEFSP